MEPRVWPTLLSDTPAGNGGGVSYLALDLAKLHWDTAPGDEVRLQIDVAEDLLEGAGFERVDAGSGEEANLVRRLRTLPDTVGPGMRVLVCGLNPSIYSADRGFGYARPGNRFWPAAVASGLVTKAKEPLHALQVDGVGMTDLVKRATVAAAELTPDEYRAGVARVRRLVERLRPPVVLFVGLAGWRAAVDRHAGPGWQPDGVGSARAYVMPSTSGLNARTSHTALADHMQAAVA